MKRERNIDWEEKETERERTQAEDRESGKEGEREGHRQGERKVCSRGKESGREREMNIISTKINVLKKTHEHHLNDQQH